MSKFNVVLDKSFLRGAGRKKVCQLCESHNVLMPESLFYELLTTDNRKDRAICFGNLPDTDNPVVLIQGIASILRYEIINKRPIGGVKKMSLDVQYNFNEGLRHSHFQFADKYRQTISEWQIDVASRIEGFKEKCACTSGWFPKVKGYKPGSDPKHIDEAQSLLCKDRSVVREIYRAIRHDTFPDTEALTKKWALFRYLQAHIYIALEYVRKYGDENSSISSQKIENEMLDLDYCITALLVGALASNDAALVTMFKRLRPEGVVISSNESVCNIVNKLEILRCL